MSNDLRKTIMDDLKKAMKSGDSNLKEQLRAITAKLKDLDVAARAKGSDVGEGDILQALRSMIKSRQESIKLYEKGNRPELVEKEEGEIETIKKYLPPEMDAHALEEKITSIISEIGAHQMKDMGKVMAVLKERYGVSFDPSLAAQLVKKILTNS